MKRVLKEIFSVVASLLVLPLVWIFKIFGRMSEKDALFNGIGQTLSLLPGKFGSYFRVAFYRQTVLSMTKNTYMGFGSWFSHPEVQIGSGVYFGAYCIIGKCRIGAYCTIGSNVHFLSGKRQHNFSKPDIPVQKQGGKFDTLEIGENCWIGNGAIIMADVGRQCVIGAGSVVTKNARDYEMLAGNPARVIRTIAHEEEGEKS